MSVDTIPKRHRRLHWRQLLLTVVGLVVLGGVLAAGLVMDKREDRERPMYHDVVAVAGLEWDLITNDRPGVEVTADSDSGPVRIGKASFQTSPGVSIVVEQHGDAMCIQGRNQYGDVSNWYCVDPSDTRRPELGSLAHNFG